jgi:hypothetical protein
MKPAIAFFAIMLTALSILWCFCCMGDEGMYAGVLSIPPTPDDPRGIWGIVGIIVGAVLFLWAGKNEPEN